MAELKDEIIFADGGLDYDSDERFIGKGDSSYRLNLIPNQLGSEMVLTNLKGNTQYTHSFTHATAYSAATYTCIGDCYDDNRDAVYLFIYSDLTNHCIYRFNFSDHSFDKICFDHTGLGFDEDYPISDAFMIGDWLHWNPRSSSPRSVNVQWAYYDWVTYSTKAGVSRSTGSYVRYYNKVYIALQSTTTVNPSTVPDEYSFVDFCYEDTYPVNGTAIDATVASSTYFKYRPFYNTTPFLAFAPTTETATDTAYEYNNIRGRRFQFCYRHYVKDQGYTAASPFTDIIANPTQETNMGEIVGDIQSQNKINIGFTVQYEAYGTDWYDNDMLFEFAEVLFREGPDDDWKVAERISHEEVVTDVVASGLQYYTIGFLNDRSYEVVDVEMIAKQFNPLPITARSQWSLDGERSAYGGVTEGRDNLVSVDVTMTTGEREIVLNQNDGALEETHSFSYSWNETLGKWTFTSEVISSVTDAVASSGEVLRAGAFGRYWYRTLTGADVVTDATYANAIVDLFAQADIQAVRSGGLTPIVTYEIDRIPDATFSVKRYASSVSVTSSYKVGSFKNGAWHPFCLFYYDAIGRRSEPVISTDLRVYMETLPEVLTAATDSTNYQRYIDWSIDHEPPSWAAYWQWGYAGNQTIDKFWQYNVKEITVNTTRGQAADDWSRIDISPLQRLADDTDTSLDHYFPNSVIEKYTWRAGDRVRFITQDKPLAGGYDDLRVAASNDDYDILEFDDVNHYIYIDELSAAPSDPDETVIIEIYRPKKQTGRTVYYEFGERYKTYTDSDVLYHRGPLVDQASGVSAEGQFNAGDVWVITRIFSLDSFSTPQPALVESYGWSDFHKTEGWGKGKTGEYTGIGQKYLNNVRYGNRYAPTSQSSGMATFDFLDYRELSMDHGYITAMRQVGDTLKIYFERNTASVMVNKTQFYSADGVSQVLKSDKVLGSVTYSNYHYGTIFPESVCMKDRTVFFYDIYRDAVIQDSANGFVAISDAKMKKYFSDKSAALLDSGVEYVEVFFSYDYDLDSLFVIFHDALNYANNECVVYNDTLKRWVTFASWEITGGDFGDLFTLSLPESPAGSPHITMAGSWTTPQYRHSFTVSANGTFSGVHTYGGTNAITVYAGDVIAISAYIQSGDQSVKNLLYIVINDPSGETSTKLTDYTSGSQYSYTYTALSNGTLDISFKVSGTEDVIQNETAMVYWFPAYVRMEVPRPSRAVSNFCSYYNEDVWIHNSHATRNYFWGIFTDSSLNVISNINANMVKEFLTMAIHSNKPWDVTSITIPATINYPEGMYSLIPEARFEEDEGVLRSDYLCNMKTTSSSATVPDLLNGDNLRGYVIIHTLVNDDTTEMYLFKVDVSSNVSKM